LKSTFYVSSGVILAVLIASIASIPSAFASTNAYNSGYDHGCDDADISDPSDRYINQPGKGSSFHSGAFMDGYNAGFNSCSGSGDDNDNNDNDNNDNDNKDNDNNDGGSRSDESLGEKACKFVRNPIGGLITELAGNALGLPPGTTTAASGLCPPSD
jgi:hypothetical protein